MKKIQAYFENENDAEAAKAKLQTIHIQNESVEKVPSDDKKIRFDILDISPQEDSRPHVLQFEVEETNLDEANRIINDSKGHLLKE